MNDTWIYSPHEDILRIELYELERSIDRYETILRTAATKERPIISATRPLLEEKIQHLKALHSVLVRQLQLLAEQKEQHIN